MRLQPQQRQLIITLIQQCFGRQARVWLFGSRTDDTQKGGDVDLYVEPEAYDLKSELLCKMRLEESLDLHVDLIVKRHDQEQPIHAIAKTTGVRL